MHFIEGREKERKRERKEEQIKEDTHEAHCKAVFTYDHRDNHKKSALHIDVYIYMYV